MSKKFAFVFPGQGAQSVGMGKASAESNPAIAAIYKKTDEIFGRNPSISEVSFNGPEETLTKTLYTQPAILTLSIALAAELKKLIASQKITAPSFVAGHSLGEFSALYMADVLSLEEVVKLVVKRAQLMEAAAPGAMTAIVGMEEGELNSIIAEIEGASVANYNAPDQIVATGTKAAMEALGKRLAELIETQGLRAKVIPLSVGGAFHSPLMNSAAEEFAKEIDACTFNDAKIPVIQNINAQATTKASDIKANLKQQMTGSVQWTKTVAQLINPETGVNEIWEIGPGKVLAGLVKKQERRFPVQNISSVEEINTVVNAVAA